nr:PREDICTED: uncharacterized protein LOC109455568 [Rhinolophus sinicus]XP_019602746.1 PREDICTED: uncharacterized protein LOC109455568 [Rhinolophus sinicus]XP_019602747.1 PREDICTED: uncharacterized protein LOC109455568 [Rhinolophus sinicus]
MEERAQPHSERGACRAQSPPTCRSWAALSCRPPGLRNKKPHIPNLESTRAPGQQWTACGQACVTCRVRLSGGCWHGHSCGLALPVCLLPRSGAWLGFQDTLERGSPKEPVVLMDQPGADEGAKLWYVPPPPIGAPQQTPRQVRPFPRGPPDHQETAHPEWGLPPSPLLSGHNTYPIGVPRRVGGSFGSNSPVFSLLSWLLGFWWVWGDMRAACRAPALIWVTTQARASPPPAPPHQDGQNTFPPSLGSARPCTLRLYQLWALCVLTTQAPVPALPSQAPRPRGVQLRMRLPRARLTFQFPPELGRCGSLPVLFLWLFLCSWLLTPESSTENLLSPGAQL